MKKMWKNRSGVSPVIATILMVAITVVLAAVLYVMVMGMSNNPVNNPVVSITSLSTSNPNQQKIQIASITEAQNYASTKVSIVAGTTAYSATVAPSTMDFMPDLPIEASTAIAVTFIDISNDGKVSSGDYFLVTAPDGTVMTLSLLYGPDSISLASTSWAA